MSKHDLYCTHCGKLIPHGTDALDFEGLIYCNKYCIDEEIDDINYYTYYSHLSDEKIDRIIEEDGGVRPFDWSITDC